MRSHNRLTNQARTPIRHPVSFLTRIVAQCVFPRSDLNPSNSNLRPTVSESSNLGGLDGLAQGSVIGERSAEAQEEPAEEQCQPLAHIHGPNDCLVVGDHSISVQEESCEEKGQPGRVTIDTLPDDALLEIFSSYLLEDSGSCHDDTETWHTLIHVCRRWRNIVFESPRRLNLRIRCTARTPVTAMSNVWPTLPIVITDEYSNVHSPGSSLMEGVDNIVAALELKDRVHQISLWNYPSPRLERIAAAMLGPFPALTCLHITLTDFSGAFSGGSAPRLRSCFLMGIPFPGVQELLLSANHLVSLTLRDVPRYILPEVMVTYLSVMPNLKQFWLGFSSRESIPDQPSQRPPPRTTAVLPTLTDFGFEGAAEYLEDLLPRIDTPLLYKVYIYYDLLIVFNTPQLHNFLARSQIFKSCSGAVVEFYDEDVYFRHGRQFSLGFSSGTLLGQLSSLVQVCSLSLPPICTLERLDIRLDRSSMSPLIPPGVFDVETIQWLEFFSPFTALNHLYLDKYCAQRIARALRLSHLAAVGATQVLPALQSVFIEGLSGLTEEAIAIWEFVTLRQLSGLPVTAYSLDGWTAGIERSWGRRSFED